LTVLRMPPKRWRHDFFLMISLTFFFPPNECTSNLFVSRTARI
jgi:hypothetical protein